MLAQQELSLDDQAKWEFIQEIERYHRKLRHIHAVKCDVSVDLVRKACEEHIHRITGIYMQLGARLHKTGLPIPWATRGGPAN